MEPVPRILLLTGMERLICFSELQKGWDSHKSKRVVQNKVHNPVFLRYYQETRYLDAVKCPMLEWETRPGGVLGSPFMVLKSIEAVTGVEMVVPKRTFTHGKELVYCNVYYR